MSAAGCGGSDDAASSRDTDTTTTTVFAADAGATGADPAAVPPADAPEPPATDDPDTIAALRGAECVPGTWRLRSQEFLDSIITAMGPAASEITEWSHGGGEYVATFAADGTLLNERRDWQLRIGAPVGTLVTTISSIDPGTWSADGDQLTIEDFGSEAKVRLQLEIGGQLQDLPIGGTQTVGTDPISGTGPYTCDGDVMTAMVTPAEENVMVEATWDRIGS